MLFAFVVLVGVVSHVHASVCEDVRPQLDLGLGYKTLSSCETAGGCWDSNKLTCFAPKISGYQFSKDSHRSRKNALFGNLTLIAPSGVFGGDFKTLNLEVVQETKSRMHVKIAPAGEKRWEIPESIIPRPPSSDDAADSNMSAFIPSQSPFEFVVSRGADPIFILSKMLVFQDQYLQVVLGVPKGVRNTYGFGEATRSKQALQPNEAHTLWATDYGASGFDKSLYGSHPFYIQVKEDGSANGFFYLNSNAMEATLFSDSEGDSIGIQAAGGVMDFYIFSGPTPKDVLKQYFEVIGKPALVPYWSLGFHNCRWGYPSIAYVSEVVANYSAAGIPLETQWVDIDYMDEYKDFTVDPVDFALGDMQAFVNKLHDNGQHFVPIVDPGIYAGPANPEKYPALVDGLAKDVFIKDLTGEAPMLGQVWPGATYYPDWFASNITDYWTGQHVAFHQQVAFDGIWIDMNEVSNFCNANGAFQVCSLDPDSSCPDGCCLACSTVDKANVLDFPPYVPHVSQGHLGAKTIAMSSLHAGGVREYNAHSLYGLMESIETRKAVIAATGGKRPFLLSRSTFPSSGVHTAHWTGDNAATWADLSASIITMNNLAMFGMSMTGADICGFQQNTTEELCARWIEVGAFSPFSRDHTEINSLDQELYRWESVAAAGRTSLNMRYRLLPHLYTLLFRAASEGITVMNALWINYPADKEAFAHEGQYMWDDSILFTPVLSQGAASVEGYFPAGKWYPLFDEEVQLDASTHEARAKIISSETGVLVSLPTPLTTTNAHVRGGSIVPMQQAAMTTQAARASEWNILVALDSAGQATGSLYLDDDGASASNTDYQLIQFTASEGVLTASVQASSASAPSPSTGHVGTVEVRGVLGKQAHTGSSQVQCSASLLHAGAAAAASSVKATYDSARDRLVVDLSEFQVKSSSVFTLQWKC